MKLQVNKVQRYAKMRAHTATHLLHFALHQFLQGTKQAGSLVKEDYLRFDFAAKKPLHHEAIIVLEHQINNWIRQSLTVSTQEVSYDEAIKQGAKAFFEDKYGDIVRVVTISSTDQSGGLEENTILSSIELCGGTHVDNTKDIGAFKITGQEAVASGIRRISAVTGPQVATFTQQLEQQNQQLALKLSCQPKQITEKVEKILKEHEELKADYESIQTQIIATTLKELVNNSDTKKQEPWEYMLNISSSSLTSYNFKTIVNQAKTIRSGENRILYNNDGNFAIYTGEGNLSAKVFSKEQGLKGGGSDQLVQGRDEKITKIIS